MNPLDIIQTTLLNIFDFPNNFPVDQKLLAELKNTVRQCFILFFSVAILSLLRNCFSADNKFCVNVRNFLNFKDIKT